MTAEQKLSIIESGKEYFRKIIIQVLAKISKFLFPGSLTLQGMHLVLTESI